jgi:hypothetical protein
MADDYGALVLLEDREPCGAVDVVEVSVLESAFAKGRSFELSARGL